MSIQTKYNSTVIKLTDKMTAGVALGRFNYLANTAKQNLLNIMLDNYFIDPANPRYQALNADVRKFKSVRQILEFDLNQKLQILNKQLPQATYAGNVNALIAKFAVILHKNHGICSDLAYKLLSAITNNLTKKDTDLNQDKYQVNPANLSQTNLNQIAYLTA